MPSRRGSLQRLSCLLIVSVKVVALVSMSDEGVKGVEMLKEPECRCVLAVDGEGIEIEGERSNEDRMPLR
jgi:hypothetical protein